MKLASKSAFSSVGAAAVMFLGSGAVALVLVLQLHSLSLQSQLLGSVLGPTEAHD